MLRPRVLSILANQSSIGELTGVLIAVGLETAIIMTALRLRCQGVNVFRHCYLSNFDIGLASVAKIFVDLKLPMIILSGKFDVS